MTGLFLRRAATALVAGAALALLAACSSSTTESALHPTRVVSFGDSIADQGQAGSSYTVNDGGNSTWLTQLGTIRYGSPQLPSSKGGLAYGQANARISQKPDAVGNASTPTVTEQIDSFLASNRAGDGDLIVLSAGIGDMVAQVAALNAGTQNGEQLVANMEQAGRDLGAQARRLVNAGFKHVVVVGMFNLAVTPWASATGGTGLLLRASTRFNDMFKVAAVDLGENLLYVDAAYYLNLVATNPIGYDLDNAVTPVCTSVDPGPGIGIGAGQINSALCNTSTLLSGANYNRYMWADAIYPAPQTQRLLGEYAYLQIHNRW